MNEIRDLIIGIDFGKDYSQICYYDRKGEEPRSVSMKVGAEEYEAPTCICRRGEQKEYTIGLEAVYFAREKGGQMVDDLYGICKKEESVQLLGEQVQPWELLQIFLEGMLKFLGVADIVKNTKCLVLTSPELSDTQVKNMEKACQAIGPRTSICWWITGRAFTIIPLPRKGRPGTGALAGMILTRIR